MATAVSVDLFIEISGLTISILSLLRLFYLRYLEKTVRRFFFMIFGIVSGYTFCLLIRELIRYHTEYSWAVVSRVVFFGQAFLSSLLTVLIISFLLYQSGEPRYKSAPVFRAAVLMWLVYVALLIYTQFTGTIYSVDNQNHYTRGPLFALQMIPPVLIMLMNIIILWKRRNKLSRKQLRAFTAYAIIPLICMFLQTFLFGIHLIALGTVAAAFIMYNYIVSDQMELFIKQQEENARLKIDILLAQIQPHFLFNSLTTIQHLCKNNPDMAAVAVGDFTEYLRHNMDSITIDKPIPFEDELSHVQAYLALQKIRFGDELQVRYELEYTDFMIPTLTFQPLVENAVSYGVRKSESGSGTVTIRSRRFEDRIELSVEDDGPGFEYAEIQRENSSVRSHTGIRNVKERLRRLSEGDLLIFSAPGKGTKATIVLPFSPDDA